MVGDHVLHGRWDEVLKCLETVELDGKVLFDLYELLFLEMLEKGERITCQKLLCESSAFAYLRSTDPLSNVRCKRLEALLQSEGTAKSVFGDRSRSERRKSLINDIKSKSKKIPQSRLLSLVKHGLMWERHVGMIPTDCTFVDLITGEAKKSESGELRVMSVKQTIKLPKGSFPESAIFTRDGRYIISGSSDGLIEVYSVESGRLALEFEYQARDDFMVHESSVTALGLSHSGDILASGDKNGQINFWNLKTGELIKSIRGLHKDTITSIQFSAEDSQVLTAGLDKLAQVIGVRSGRSIERFIDHGAFVTSALFLGSDNVVTSCCDGYIRVFRRATGQTITLFSPSSTPGGSLGVTALKGIVLAPSSAGDEHRLIVCPNSNTGIEISPSGDVHRTFDVEPAGGCDFQAVQVSPIGSWVYFGSENGKIHAFDRPTGELVQTIDAAKSSINCLVHHPKKAVLAATSNDGCIYLLGR